MIKKNLLGNTGILVSAIGLGTVKFGRNQQVHYPQPFELPSDVHIQKMLTTAQILGINLLDTAPAYGSSEERLGKLLQGWRSEWVISSKVGEELINGQPHYDFSAGTIQKSVERSLQRLRTDYLDIVLVHSNGEDEKIIAEQAVFSTLADIKKSGKIRAFGMSTKTVAGGILTVEHSDVVMVMYNPINTEEQSVITHAHVRNKGVFIKKAFASGHLQKIAASDPVLTALRFIFQTNGVSSIILGTVNIDHLKNNIQCATQALTELRMG